MPAVSNRSRAATRRSARDRFSDAVLKHKNHAIDPHSALGMPIGHFAFEKLLNTSLARDLHDRNLKAVLANDRSSDLVIFAATDAFHTAGHRLDAAWWHYTRTYADHMTAEAA